MKRPLLITDCDEVLLHMVVPFREWLDEQHDIHFDMHDRGFSEALRHKDSGQPVERPGHGPAGQRHRAPVDAVGAAPR